MEEDFAKYYSSLETESLYLLVSDKENLTRKQLNILEIELEKRFEKQKVYEIQEYYKYLDSDRVVQERIVLIKKLLLTGVSLEVIEEEFESKGEYIRKFLPEELFNDQANLIDIILVSRNYFIKEQDIKARVLRIDSSIDYEEFVNEANKSLSVVKGIEYIPLVMTFFFMIVVIIIFIMYIY